MGILAAVCSKKGRDVSATLLKMLEASPGRGDYLGVASERGAIVKRSLDSLEVPVAPALLGHKTVKIEPIDPSQPLSQHGYPFVFEGRIWHNQHKPSISAAADTLGRDPVKGIRDLIKEQPGSYAVAAINRGAIHFGRDPIGTVPIYYGEDSEKLAIASCKKMLWAAGLEAKTLSPGHMATVGEAGISIERVRTIELSPPVKITMEEAVEKIDALLTRAVNTRCEGLFHAPLGFSGGIDSSLLANYLDEAGADVDLVCVGIEGSKEFSTAEDAADSLDLPIRMESFTPEDVEEDLDSVLWAIEESDPMKTAVALPLHWTTRIASQTGARVLFSGNGSDELFGGYQKYVKEFIEGGEAVRETMFGDVAASHEVNYERDQKVCMGHGMELRFPYADLGLVEFGLSLPTELKMTARLGSPRKLVLRRLAETLGVHDEIANRPKKAVQYSTGVNNALKKLAKREGISLAGFLHRRFEDLKKERLGR